MKSPSGAVPPASTFRVLLIDDNKHGLCARKTVLEDAGYAVTACLTPEDALKKFSPARFELIVTDFRMPGMNGVELITRIRTLQPGIPIVLISGMVDVLGLTEQNTGADVVIAKTSTEIPYLLRAAGKLLKKSVRSQSRSPLARTS